MDKVGYRREVLVKCPQCGYIFNAETVFWTVPRFADIDLHCPKCGTDFPKEACRVWGLEVAS